MEILTEVHRQDRLQTLRTMLQRFSTTRPCATPLTAVVLSRASTRLITITAILFCTATSWAQQEAPSDGAGLSYEAAAAVAKLAAQTGRDRDRDLLAILADGDSSTLREHAALALSRGSEDQLLPALKQILSRERNSNVRYAITHAIAQLEQRSGVQSPAVHLEVNTTGLAQVGESGLITLFARSDEPDGFARISLQMPQELTPWTTDANWEGVMRTGDERTLTVQVSAKKEGLYFVHAVFWLRLTRGDTFKGGNRIKDVWIPVRIGGSGMAAPQHVNAIEIRSAQ